MPSREQIAAALKYMGDKANLRQRFERATSLDPQEQDMADIAVETAASFVPGVGQALAARDVERARRANDPAGMAMASMGAIPGGRLAKLLKRYDPVMQQLDVYHGTPHRFPATEANPLGEFDASKIGTGEGAQAYGHGIYFAEAKDVADQYANMPKFKLGVVENAQELGNNAKSFVERVEKFGSVEKAKVEAQELLREMQKQNIFPAVQQQLANEIDVANKLEKKIKVKATEIEPQVYKADLPDEMIDRMLDWDKPLSEQPAAIQEVARKIGIGKAAGRTKAKLQAFIDGTETPETGRVAKGGDLYLALSDYGNESVAGTRALQEAGILGIKYKDAGSRGQGGTGTRNFVVFPGEEKKVRILERK